MRILISILTAAATASAAFASTPATARQTPQSIQCVAAFELMHRAAPNWTRQSTAQSAWQSWDSIARDLTSQAQVDLNEQVQREMETLANQTATVPEKLSQTAIKCVADAPQI